MGSSKKHQQRAPAPKTKLGTRAERRRQRGDPTATLTRKERQALKAKATYIVIFKPGKTKGLGSYRSIQHDAPIPDGWSVVANYQGTGPQEGEKAAKQAAYELHPDRALERAEEERQEAERKRRMKAVHVIARQGSRMQPFEDGKVPAGWQTLQGFKCVGPKPAWKKIRVIQREDAQAAKRETAQAK